MEQYKKGPEQPLYPEGTHWQDAGVCPQGSGSIICSGTQRGLGTCPRLHSLPADDDEALSHCLRVLDFILQATRSQDDFFKVSDSMYIFKSFAFLERGTPRMIST